MVTFKELGLNPQIIKGLDDLGFVDPWPIQEKVIPFILKSKKDLIALAQTGTGKTAAFGLPILNQIGLDEKDLRAIILCPTRELCLQIFQDLKEYAKYLDGITVAAVYGGERIGLQISLLKKRVNIVVGTPGRVHDLIRRKVLKLQYIKWLVLDEADEMLDMGFKDDLDAILEQIPKTRQTLLFSATMSKSVNSIAKQYMNEVQEISIGEKNIGAEKVTHEYYIVQHRDRFEVLKRILDYLPGVYGILFCRTRNETQIVADKLKQANYNADALHGDISQHMRTKIMNRFKQKQIHLLVATDVAARGIDVSDLSHIINYNLPDHDKIYTHRSGRTGRAQKSGVSISLITQREIRRISSIESIVGKKFEYKKVPSRQDVFTKQINNFFAEIENTEIKEIGHEQYFSKVVDKLKKISKEDLIKSFIALKFNHLIDEYRDAPDLNAKERSPKSRLESKDSVNLKINFGRKHKFDVKGFFTLINSNKNLKGVEIGRISLMSDYSIFAVDKNRADDVIENLKGTSFRGKKIDIVRSNIKPSYPNKRRGMSRRGFSGKKMRFRRRNK